MREWKTAAELAQRNESTRLTKQQFGQATESTQRPGRIRKLLGDGREKRGGGDEPEDGPTSNGAGVRSSRPNMRSYAKAGAQRVEGRRVALRSTCMYTSKGASARNVHSG